MSYAGKTQGKGENFMQLDRVKNNSSINSSELSNKDQEGKKLHHKSISYCFDKEGLQMSSVKKPTKFPYCSGQGRIELESPNDTERDGMPEHIISSLANVERSLKENDTE